jgi:hypothetical protein
MRSAAAEAIHRPKDAESQNLQVHEEEMSLRQKQSGRQYLAVRFLSTQSRL